MSLAGEVLDDLLKTINYEVYLFDQDDQRAAQTKWNNVLEFAAWIAKKGEEDEKDLLQLTQTIALITLLEGREDEEPDAVRLSTLHAAKGLEFGQTPTAFATAPRLSIALSFPPPGRRNRRRTD